MGDSKDQNANGVAKRKDFPDIVLDVTLAELFSQEEGGSLQEVMCHFKPNADRRYKATPFNEKFLITSTNAPEDNVMAHLLLENVSNLLMFPMGPGELAYVASEGISDDPSLSRDAIQATATKNFGVLQERQRPSITTYRNAQDFVDNHKGKPVRWGFAIDFAEKVPSIFEPELVYKINSKRWLAECSLNSANDRILDCEAKCSSHTTNDGLWYYGGDNCSECSQGVKDEIERIRKVLEETPAPFVLKLTQCLGSVGTHIVQKEEDKQPVIDYITKENLPSYLPRVSVQNAHIKPTALVLSDFIKGDTWALNFFIRKDGSPVFLGACNQLTTRSTGGRQSTGIFYKEQPKLEKKFYECLKSIGEVLKNEGGGYYGPVGADIMEDPDDGTYYVIDLNVRVPTSFTLYLLKGHCEKRGFAVGTVYECIILNISREDFEDKFYKEFEEGRIVLLGSTRLGDKASWAYPIILTGEDRDTVQELGKRILKYEVGGKDEEAGQG